jgi:uncharacterized protein (DUF1330 family)
MSYYFIAQIKIVDEEEYKKYLDGAGDIFKKFQGEYLAVDNAPEILEGNWDYSRTVMIKFESRSDFDDWYHSVDYQTILKHRLSAAGCDTILVKGLD